MSHESGFGKAVEVVVEKLELFTLVGITDLEGRATNVILTVDATSQAPHKGGLATPQIAREFKGLTASKIPSQLLGYFFGRSGAFGGCLPDQIGTHMLRIVPRGHLLRQAAKVAHLCLYCLVCHWQVLE